jgi:peptide/nickel transport system permease protein
MIRNIFPLFIIQLRTSIWIILTNPYLLEFMFNINGFTKTFPIAMGMGEFLLLVICLLLFTLPLLLIEALSLLVLTFFKGKNSVSLGREYDNFFDLLRNEEVSASDYKDYQNRIILITT